MAPDKVPNMDLTLEDSEMQEPEIKPPKNRRHRRRLVREQAESVDVSQASNQTTSIRETVRLNSYSSDCSPRRRMADPSTIGKVESIVSQINQSLLDQDDCISIPLRMKRRANIASPQPSARSLNENYQLSFPGNTPEEAWRFTVVLRILELIHEALVANLIISKRNIYYKDPELFRSQSIVDRYIDILAYTFGIQRAALNVTATAKGLVAGTFKIRYYDGSSSACEGAKDAVVIDRVDEIGSIDISNVDWVLVVEKEAKGYPDISTRAFLRLLSISAHPPPPIYALVDFDPDGIAIMSIYKYGSFTLSHENANIRTPTVRWLGIKSKDLVSDEFNAASDDGDRKGLLSMSTRDRKKAAQMLGKAVYDEDGVEQEWRRELQVMLMLNLKVEMEILSEREGGVERWVEQRLCEGPVRSG
ncbi:MAG: hypothetical protein L6R39_004917 [Caloplaca ligustica]|nr:MAG: hypothetical protein L6R39_004917 [Caloplaca ligustica]